MYSAEQTSKLAQWRARAADGSLTIDDMREAIALLRQGRAEAAQASTKARAKAKAKAGKSSGEMLSELEGL